MLVVLPSPVFSFELETVLKNENSTNHFKIHPHVKSIIRAACTTDCLCIYRLYFFSVGQFCTCNLLVAAINLLPRYLVTLMLSLYVI